MAKQKFKMTFKCSDCKSTFEKFTTNKNLMNPRCPYCKEANEATKLNRIGDGAITDDELNLIMELRKKDFSKDPNYLSKMLSPVSHASRMNNKAMDETAAIVMQDYKMGDISDKRIRPGENMAPRLDPARQNMADNMFAKKKGPLVGFDLGTGRAAPIKGNMNMGGMVRSAMAGAYRDGAVDPVAAVQSNRQRMPINIINKNSN